jgi:hypothetical protein
VKRGRRDGSDSGYNDTVALKPRPNHARYLAVLRAMTPEQRLAKAFELSAFSKELFLQGLRRRFPDLDAEQLHRLALDRLEKCHNRNY